MKVKMFMVILVLVGSILVGTLEAATLEQIVEANPADMWLAKGSAQFTWTSQMADKDVPLRVSGTITWDGNGRYLVDKTVLERPPVTADMLPPVEPNHTYEQRSPAHTIVLVEPGKVTYYAPDLNSSSALPFGTAIVFPILWRGVLPSITPTMRAGATPDGDMISVPVTQKDSIRLWSNTDGAIVSMECVQGDKTAARYEYRDHVKVGEKWLPQTIVMVTDRRIDEYTYVWNATKPQADDLCIKYPLGVSHVVSRKARNGVQATDDALVDSDCTAGPYYDPTRLETCPCDNYHVIGEECCPYLCPPGVECPSILCGMMPVYGVSCEGATKYYLKHWHCCRWSGGNVCFYYWSINYCYWLCEEQMWNPLAWCQEGEGGHCYFDGMHDYPIWEAYTCDVEP